MGQSSRVPLAEGVNSFPEIVSSDMRDSDICRETFFAGKKSHKSRHQLDYPGIFAGYNNKIAYEQS